MGSLSLRSLFCILPWLSLVSNAQAFPLRVDIGNIGQPVKPGWEEFSGNGSNEIDPKTEVYLVDGRSIAVSLRTGVLDDSGYRTYGGGALGGDMLYPDNQYGTIGGRVILMLGNLPAGDYVLTSYHNDTKDTHAQQHPIDVTVSGAVSASMGEISVIQTKNIDDSNLGRSTVTFTAEGSGDVVVTYAPFTEIPLLSKAVLNGFELDIVCAAVQFDLPASSGAESAAVVYLAVHLDNPPEANTVTVDYAVTGGTATGGGVDYTLSAGKLTFQPGQTTPEYISIYLVDDGLAEADETIKVALSGPVNARLGANSQHVFTILDTNPKVGFDATESKGSESISPVYVPVSLSKAWPYTVTVDYNVTGGTATAGEDYILSYGTLVFDPCELTGHISISILEDDFHEDPDETIEITLSNPGNAGLGVNTRHTFTILPAVVRLCPAGDLDGDCKLDFNDLEVFSGQWLAGPNSCSGFDCADLDGLDGVNMRDFALLAADWLERLWPLVINEFMASNANTLEDPCEPGEFPDWIELYNGGPLSLDLGGMYLTDNLGNPTKWQIPAGVGIGAGQYLIFWADDDNGQGPTHTSFKLGASGEEIGLFAADGSTMIDSIRFGAQVTDISYGRYPDVGTHWRFFGTPTPGWKNEGAYLGEVADTKFSHNRGFYESPFLLSITCNTADAEIHYTLNGSEPNEFVGGDTYLYTAPIDINRTTVLRAAAFKPGYLPTNVDAQTYIFLDDVLLQPGINQTVVTTYGAGVLKDALRSIPTLSLVMNQEDYGALITEGVLNPEFAAAVELIYADTNDAEGFQTNCGISRHSKLKTKQAFRLEFKSEFGPPSLEYPFFESDPVGADSAVDTFDRIVLRSPGNMPVTYVGDPWTAESQVEMCGIGVHSTHVHLYVNGEYRGVYNPKERPDAWFTSSYLGGDFEDYFATNHGVERCYECGGSLCPRPTSPCHLSGDHTRFARMMELAYERGLSDPNKYAEFITLCDAAEFADYTILFWLSGFGDNMDNNWYAGMRNVPLEGSIPPEGLMMFMWDAEYVFLNAGGPPGSEDPWVPYYFWSAKYKYVISDIWQALFDNRDFRMLFADRVYKHCFNGGALMDQNAQARWNALTDFIGEAVLCEKARWGGADTPTAVNMTGHVAIFIDALRNWSHASYPGVKLYPTIDPPVFNQHGGHVASGFGLTITNPNSSGVIYYTLDGSDPRQAVTGNHVGTPYAETITLNLSRHVKARVFDDPNWSALNEVIFAVGPVADNLRITEIMYHPQDTNEPNDPNTEFIELRNVGGLPVNLNLVRFSEGIDFTFPPLSLSPKEHILVVKNENAFFSKYPGFYGVVAGEYTGSLNNGGERIKLQDAVGQTILDFNYSDGWRAITDGDGFSLTIIDPNAADVNNWCVKDSWRPSAYVGGSPGWDDSGIVPNPSTVVINEVMSHSHGNAPDWIELYNTTAKDINIGGWFLSDSDSNVIKYEIAPGTLITAGQYLVFYEDVNFGDMNDPGCHIPFALSENGEKVCLSSGLDGNGFLTGYRQVEDFGASESDVSFGRYYKSSTGNYNFVAMDHNTPGAGNAYPKVGPLVINEIMYNPDWPAGSLYGNDSFEYIELYNITGSDVNLFDEQDNPWKFTDGIEFTFPADANLPAHGYLLVVKDPEAFAWRYGGMPAGVQVFGPYDGQLSNGSEKLELSMPGDVDEFATQYYIRIDRVNYSDGSHPEDCPEGVDLWPVEADGGGKSLGRILPADFGNDVIYWAVKLPSPGAANP